jgi:hypothetical protein
MKAILRSRYLYNLRSKANVGLALTGMLLCSGTTSPASIFCAAKPTIATKTQHLVREAITGYSINAAVRESCWSPTQASVLLINVISGFRGRAQYKIGLSYSLAVYRLEIVNRVRLGTNPAWSGYFHRTKTVEIVV